MQIKETCFSTGMCTECFQGFVVLVLKDPTNRSHRNMGNARMRVLCLPQIISIIIIIIVGICPLWVLGQAIMKLYAKHTLRTGSLGLGVGSFMPATSIVLRRHSGVTSSNPNVIPCLRPNPPQRSRERFALDPSARFRTSPSRPK